MNYRKLGKTGLAVSEIGFGSWGMGGGWGIQNDSEAVGALRRAIDLGVNFFDTALLYGSGHSEQLIGQVVGDIRDRVIIATKIPPKNHSQLLMDDVPIAEAFPTDWIVECTEKSLRHLDTDYVDVQQLHRWMPHWIKQMEWYESLDRLKRQGKIRAFGVSANPWDAFGPLELIESELTDTVQIHYNIFVQRPAEKLLPAAKEHGVGIIVRVPFEEGLLTGRITPGYRFSQGDWRKDWLTPERLGEIARRLEALKPFLAEDRPSLPALALKFCLSHPAVSTVIPGMRTVAHVEANCRVSDGKLLSSSDLEKLKEHHFLHGWRFPWLQ